MQSGGIKEGVLRMLCQPSTPFPDAPTHPHSASPQLLPLLPLRGSP